MNTTPPDDEPQAAEVPVDLRTFLQNLIERCKHGDINADCDDLDWRAIYVDATRLLAQPNALRTIPAVLAKATGEGR